MLDFFNIDSLLSEDERAVRDSVRRFVDERVLPIIGQCYVDGRFPKEIIQVPRSWAETVYDIRRWTVMESGGHFAAAEEPEALAADVQAFFRDLR